MIKFRCTCQTTLEVSDDFAGSSLQCPRCRRLLDVPTLSELQSLSDDGSFKISDVELHDDPDRLADLQRVYAPRRVDDHGNEIDLRGQYGLDDAPLPLDDDDVLEVVNEEPIPPKYDPETGELVRAIEVKEDGPPKFDPNAIPMAKAVINYASAQDTRQFSGWQIIPALFRLENVFVMAIILVVHVFLQLLMAPIAAGMIIAIPAIIIVIMAMLGHYGNVIEDIGFEGRDELPRPLRDVSLYDDIWRPFINMSLAMLVCYGPLMFYARFPALAAVAYLFTVLILGTIAFPAVVLTTTTSGSILNLAPHKILRVISAMGFKYIFAVGLWIVAGAIYFVGIGASLYTLARLLTSFTGTVGGMVIPILLAYPLLLIGIMLAHGFCWYLGLQYRAHHDEFDWYLQQHQRKIEMIKSPTGNLVPAPTRPVAPRKPPPIGPKAKAIPAPNEYPQSHA